MVLSLNLDLNRRVRRTMSVVLGELVSTIDIEIQMQYDL
ncbi:MAG: hypothetical protein JWP85_1539 [Rhodoglobus sp.]|nr:hypothetical protein [Rhodoglobus sp.]